MVVKEALNEFADMMFVGPMWPASILVCLMVLYTLIALLGLIEIDIDGIDVDLDADVGADVDVPDLDVGEIDLATGDLDVDLGQTGFFGFLSGIGATSVRWTNFGRVPLVIWFGVFTIVFWTISYVLWNNFDSIRYAADWWPSTLLAVRNGVLAIIATKFITQPVVGKFTPEPGYDTNRILGATCEISSIKASPSFGQAKFRTNAAPLLLNVRTNGSEIPKGTEVRIVDYDPRKRIYTVTEIQPELQS